MFVGDYDDGGISESRAAIETYSNYNEAWCWRGQTDCLLGVEQSDLLSFQRLKASPHGDRAAIKRHLRRGNATLQLVNAIPVDEMPEFAVASALWVPVQAYYAVHGFALALLAATSSAASMPRNHSALMKVGCERIVERLFPRPFSAVLRGGYEGWQHLPGKLTGIPDRRMRIRPGLNLERPDETTREAHIAQCLSTTRRRLIESKLDDARIKARKPRAKTAHLNREQQIRIADSVGPTTVLDYLYRVRIKSNYEDTTMYEERSEHADALIELVKSTQELARIVCALIANAVWQSLDTTTRDEVNAELHVGSLLASIGAQG